MRWLLVAIIVCSTVLGDILQSREMKLTGEQHVNARGLVRLIVTIFKRRYLLLAIASMGVSFFAFMALLQNAPLSFAVPASASTLVLETILAKLVLKEAVGPRRALGAALVLGGVVLLAR